jgi:uncharacterized protein (DUF885 family)
VTHRRTLANRFGRLLTPAAWLTLLAQGQGCATAMRRPPSAADSTVAVISLDGVVDDYARFLVTSRPDLAARGSNFIVNLPDPTQDREKKDAQFARAALSSLDDIKVEALTEDDYVTWLSLRWEMEAMDGWSAFHWTRLSDLAPGHSVFDRSVWILKSQGLADSAAHERYKDLVAGVGKLARAVRAEYAERAQRDIRLARPVAARAASHVRAFLAPPFASPFLLARDSLALGDSAGRAQRAQALSDVIEKQVNPALDSLAAFLEGELERATDSLGLSRLPGGSAHYAALLRYHSTIDITPENAHVIGLREVERIAAKAAAAREAARLPANRDSLRATLRRDSSFMFDERSSLPERTAQLFESAARNLDSLFGPIPLMALTIGAMRGVSEASPLVTYDLPTMNRPSAMYLLNIEELISRSALVMPGLVATDLMPGMHLQQGTQLQNTELPAFRRLAMNAGFVHGWQMYAQDVTDSLSTTLLPWQRFSLRLRELAAACGLVVDTGINALGWSREEALAFLRAQLPDDDEDLERDFIFIASERPGELSAATLGARELRGLRRWAMRELGDRFSLPAFHAELLRLGSVPLPILGVHLERWIWDLNHPTPPPTAVRR